MHSATALATAGMAAQPTRFHREETLSRQLRAGLWEVILNEIRVATNLPCRITMVHRADCSHLQSCPPDYTTVNSERRSFDVGFAALFHASHSMPSNYGRGVGRRSNPLS
jgi:hypothetical protein